jgi:hypothetical protein
MRMHASWYWSDGSTEYKSATRYRVQGGLASEVVLMPPTASLRRDLKPGSGLAAVKGCVAARWPAATLDRRSARAPSRLEVTTQRCRLPSNKEIIEMT